MTAPKYSHPSIISSRPSLTHDTRYPGQRPLTHLRAPSARLASRTHPFAPYLIRGRLHYEPWLGSMNHQCLRTASRRVSRSSARAKLACMIQVVDRNIAVRRKLLRQNRDLAKLNNVRALRIRELENECACMLSENVELRGRIIELEKKAEDNESRRIADHALAIKAQLESQLTEWGTLIAGLGLEPPPKRRSPCIRRTSSRSSFQFTRTSPSQRRLRDVAKDIEELGHISEHKSYSRMSLTYVLTVLFHTYTKTNDIQPGANSCLAIKSRFCRVPRAWTTAHVTIHRRQPRQD